MCLAALVARGFIESALPFAISPEDADTYRQLAARLSRWLNEQDFTGSFTVEELRALSEPPGSWPSEEQESHFRRVEALNVLLWALSFHERLPSCETAATEPDLEKLIGWPRSAITNPGSEKLAAFPSNGATFLATAGKMRAHPLIAGQRSTAEAWNWRLQVAALQKANHPLPEGQSYAAMIAIAAEEAHAASAIPRPVKNDFPLNGKAFAVASEDAQQRCARLAAAHRVALNWLCGYATEWDNLPVSAAQAA